MWMGIRKETSIGVGAGHRSSTQLAVFDITSLLQASRPGLELWLPSTVRVTCSGFFRGWEVLIPSAFAVSQDCCSACIRNLG